MKDYTLWARGVYSWNARLFEHIVSINAMQHIHKIKTKNTTISVGIWQNIMSFHNKKKKNQVEIEKKCVNFIKIIYERPTDNIILNGEQLDAFSPMSGIVQGYVFLPCLLNY